jgi:chaperonin GroES
LSARGATLDRQTAEAKFGALGPWHSTTASAKSLKGKAFAGLDGPGTGAQRRGAGAAQAEQPTQEEPRAMSIRPLHDRLVVKRVQEAEKTKGGIIIPDTAKEKPIEGEVIAVGNGKVLDDGQVRKLDVKAGDRVLFGKYSGTEIKIGGEEHLILREDDVLGVVEK